MSAMKAEYAVFSCKGSRQVNEDFADVAVKNGRYCFILCDGLGGHGCGDVASRFVARHIKDYFMRCSDMERFASDALEAAHKALLEKQRSAEGSAQKMKTTAVVLTIDGNSGICAHLGDSRLYRIRGGRILSRTRDHSVPQMLYMTGEISEDEIRCHPDRNKLLRALGDDRETVKVERSRFDVRAGDVFLLCSDGFWEPVTESEMLSLLSDAPGVKKWLDEMARLAFENSDGRQMDNFTAVAVRVTRQRR